MSLVYLISDFQEGAFKIGLLRSKWLIALGRPDIIDITHNVRLNNTIEAAFIGRQIHYPENQNIISLFKIGDVKESIVYKHEDRLYIMPNNGLIGLLFDTFKQENCYIIESDNDIIAAQLFLENRLDKLQKAGGKLIVRYPKQVNINGNIATADCIYSDKFGNCYFNIKKEVFDDFTGNRAYQIRVQHYLGHHFDRMSEGVNDVDQGDALVRFSSSGYLKLQINLGNAKQLFRIKEDTKIIIELQ